MWLWALRARPLERTPGPKIQQPSPKAPSPHFSPLRLPQVERVLRPRPPLHRQVKPHDAVLVPPAHHPRTAPRSPSKSSCSLLACRSARCILLLLATTPLMTAMASSCLSSRHDSPWPLPPSAAPPRPTAAASVMALSFAWMDDGCQSLDRTECCSLALGGPAAHGRRPRMEMRAALPIIQVSFCDTGP